MMTRNLGLSWRAPISRVVPDGGAPNCLGPSGAVSAHCERRVWNQVLITLHHYSDWHISYTLMQELFPVPKYKRGNTVKFVEWAINTWQEWES